jgi:signal transduction histidine kinase
VHQQFVVVLEERARLSREIHDTLLQGLVGVALQFDIIAHDLNEPKSKARLERIRTELERYVREARQAIWDLRSLTLEQRDLTSALRQACEETTARVSVTCDFSIFGTPRPCSPQVTEQLVHIAREAMANAARHAEPDRITVVLEFTEQSLTLRVADDGRGFDPMSATADSKHFGLVTMRERATTISGSFHIESTKGGGTTVEVVVPHAGT